MIDWIRNYRTNPDWFKDETLSEQEKYHREQVFTFIENHDRVDDKLSTNRDIRLSEILDDNYIDPLKYLNKFIDVLYGRIDLTIAQPQITISYMDEPDENNIVRVYSKFVSCESIPFNTIEDFENWVIKIRKDNEFFPYTITETSSGNGQSVISLRLSKIERTYNRIGKKDFMNPLKLKIN